MVCSAPRANGALSGHVFPRLLGAHADGEILQQPRTFQLPGESARNGNAALKKTHHLLTPALWVCKLLMPVLSVSLEVTANLFVSADKAACVLAWELSESASTHFTWLLGVQRSSSLCSGCFSASALLKQCLQEHLLAACLITDLNCQC